MEELHQSSLPPLIKHTKTDMSRPGIEPQPPASQTDTKERSRMLINLSILSR
jgi:hypothetical protein